MSEAAVAYRAGTGTGLRARGGHLRLVAEPSAGYRTAPPPGADGAAAPVMGDAQAATTNGAPASVDAEEALAALAAAADLAARADWDALGERDLLEATVAADRQLTRLEAARARALAAVDRRQAYALDACVTTGSWWRLRTRRDHTAAARMAVTARRLGALPATRAALEAATITMSHAEVIAQAAIPRRRDAIAAHEDTLVQLAADALPRDVRRACARIADHVDPDGSDPPPPAGDAGPDELRELYLNPALGGRWSLRGTLDAIAGERLFGLLHSLDTPDPADTRARDRRSGAQRRHDAFDRILRAAEEHPDLPTAHGATPHAVVTLDILALLGRGDLAARPPQLGSGTEICLERVLTLLEKASLTPVLMLGPWRAVGVGRRHRTLPDWLRPILAMIHGHCRGPGCDRPITWTDAAHLTAWADNGNTDLDETIPACPGHHKLMDVAGWNVSLDPDTAICTWTSPDGRTIWTTHPPDP